MKHLVYILTCMMVMVASIPAMAQLSIGIRAAANMSTVAIDYEEEDADGFEDPDSRFGIALGVIAEIGISEMFSVQPELLFSQHGFQASGTDEIDHFGDIYLHNYDDKMRYSYLQIPILAKVKLGTEQLGFNIFAGPHMGFGIGEIEYEYDYSVTFNGMLEDEDSGSEKTSWEDANFKTFDFGITGGVGISILAGPGTLGIDARYQLGLVDISDTSEFEITAMNRNIQFGVSYLIPIGR